MNTPSAPTLLDPNAGLNHSAGLPSLPAAPRRPARPLSLAATLATLAFAPFVDGAVVLSNLAGFTQPSTYVTQGAFSNTSYEAVRVTTGPGSWTLNSVSVVAYFSGPARIVIWQGSAPGSIGSPTYASIAQNSSTDTGAPNYYALPATFTFATTVTLAGGSDYWFSVVPTTAPSYSTSDWYYSSAATPVSASGWSQAASQGTYTTGPNWAYSETSKYASLEIDATQVPSSGVPDGTTTVLLLAPLGLGLAWTGRRRGQAVRP